MFQKPDLVTLTLYFSFLFYVNTPNGTQNITCMKNIKIGITVGLISYGFPEFLKCYLQYSQVSNVCNYI